MKKETQQSLIAIPIILLVAAGVALAGSQGSVSVFGFPLFALGVVLAFFIQWFAFIPAYLFKTEKFFDLTGSLTYITVMVVAVLARPAAEVDLRGWLLFGAVTLWAVRLGSFLFMRIKAAGEDRRFREIKQSFSRFLMTWTLQGLWVTFSLAAALAALTSEVQVGFGWVAGLGFLVWVFGFAIEVTADRQKSAFKADPANEGKFIQSGLWAWSRHPNYFGEIVLWIGVAIMALPVLRGWQYVTLISPVFIILLLTRISGVPMLEERADKKWGGQEDYEAYKANTPVLVLRPPSSK